MERLSLSSPDLDRKTARARLTETVSSILWFLAEWGDNLVHLRLRRDASPASYDRYDRSRWGGS